MEQVQVVEATRQDSSSGDASSNPAVGVNADNSTEQKLEEEQLPMGAMGSAVQIAVEQVEDE